MSDTPIQPRDLLGIETNGFWDPLFPETSNVMSQIQPECVN